MDISSAAALNQAIGGAKSKPVIADFYGNSCGACARIAPTFASLANKHSKNAIFLKVNTEVAQDAAAEHGIRSIPTFIIWHNGSKVDTIIGADSAKLTNAIESIIAKTNGIYLPIISVSYYDLVFVGDK